LSSLTWLFRLLTLDTRRSWSTSAARTSRSLSCRPT